VNPITVSTLNDQIKSVVETTFTHVVVKGELSRVTYHNSGHIYFTLKDATSSIRAVMFRGNASRLKFRLEEGVHVIIDGAISLYTPRGEYQVNCFNIEPDGRGSLALAYEQLKKSLQAKGYFDRKRPLPKFPKCVAVITSATGAALQDMLRVANKRWPLVELVLFDVLTQGEGAAFSIAKAIEHANEKSFDLIVIGRGGGSIEDLWAFNEIVVADAIYQSSTPLVSAVGHEIDWLISDFCADLRAPTPSAAFEMILPDQDEMRMQFDYLKDDMQKRFKAMLDRKQMMLNHQKNRLQQRDYRRTLDYLKKELAQVKEEFIRRFGLIIKQKRLAVDQQPHYLKDRLEQLVRVKQSQLMAQHDRLHQLDPKRSSKEGYVQLVHANKISALSSLKKDDQITLLSVDTKVTAIVQNKEKIG
jgi:exodeoxyribonuclease VII large subunit